MLSDEILNNIKNQNFCRIRGDIKLTKTASNYSDVLLSRDCDLEQLTHDWIKSRIQSVKIFERYKQYDNALDNYSWPQHYPVRILTGLGSACSGKNIFMFFPYVLNQSPKNESEVFGLEFIDIWSNIFNTTIFSIANRVFTKETVLQFFSLQKNLEKTIFLASIFHEIGHRCGPYKVSPHLNPQLSLLPHYVDIMGELSTDSLLIKNLKEFPEILHFVFLQRLFWFGRKGFKYDPVSADINTDNDTWIGSLIWQQAIESQALVDVNGRYQVDFDLLKKIFDQIVLEIDSLKLDTYPANEQNSVVRLWMKSKVPNQNGVFILPDSFKKVLENLQDFEEIPHFKMPYSYNYINDLSGALQNEK